MDKIGPATARLDSDERPGLAMIANCAAPYRVNLHKLIAAGIPELKLHTLITHDDAEFSWQVDIPPSVHLSHLGKPGDSPLSGTFSDPVGEWRKGGRLIRYLQEHNIRAVITVGHRYISYLRTIRYTHRAGIPLFVWSDGNICNDRDISPLKLAVKKRLYAWWLARVAGVMPAGEYGRQFFRKYGAEFGKMYLVPCTPDYDYFASARGERLSQFRQKYGLSEQRKYLIYSGRLVPVKRVDLLIGAFAEIASDRSDWDLLVVGDGVLGDELRRSVPESLRRRVIWTGFLEQEDLVDAYHCSEVLVLPSDREPWAVVVQEAMAAGLVVIASDVVAASRDIVEDAVSGRIFPAGDKAALKQAILDVTDAEALGNFRAASPAALAAWRRRIDPVAEIRRALVANGVLRTKT